jgi:ribosomal protein S1
VKTVDFGAFVELEPGVEGLVHISELSHKRVWRTTDVVKQGDKVQALVRSVDTESRRISLSMKEAMPEPEPEKKKDEPAPEGPPTKPRKRKLPEKPLQGGLGRVRGGDKFGLNW